MKISKLFVSMALSCATLLGIAQEGMAQQVINQNKKVELVNVNGQQHLVLKTGQSPCPGSSTNLTSIELKMDEVLWKALDNLISAPIGGDAVLAKDLKGYNVEIIRASVNSKPGLMFTSCSKCVAITDEEYRSLKR